MLQPVAAEVSKRPAAESTKVKEDATVDDPYQRFKAVVETIAQESEVEEEPPERPSAATTRASVDYRSIMGSRGSFLRIGAYPAMERSMSALRLDHRELARLGSTQLLVDIDRTPSRALDVPTSANSSPQLGLLHSNPHDILSSRFSFTASSPWSSARCSSSQAAVAAVAPAAATELPPLFRMEDI